MHNSLRQGHFEACLRLAQLVQVVRPDDLDVSIYRLAALVELGRAGQAREMSARLPGRWTTHSLGDRVQQVLALKERGAKTVIRDRNGVLIGYLDQEGQLQLQPGIDPVWLPRELSRRLHDHADAGGLQLTLDLELSRIAFSSLRWRRGSVVLVDPPSGDILAAVSDARTLRREMGTPAFEQRREPASIAKLITLSAVLENGMSPDEEVRHERCNGTIRYEDGVVWCPVRLGRIRNVERALAASCNTTFAKLGDKLGPERLMEEFRRFGFDGGDFNGFPTGRILVDAPQGTEMGNLSIGLQVTDITPLHSALLAAVFANQGKMPVPGLIKAHTGSLGYSIRPIERGPSRQVIDPRWVPRLRKAMRAVTRRGTARGIAPFDFPVAMKTGTGRNPGLPFHTNYIGVGPLPHPNIAFSVRITNYWNSKHARYATRTVSRRLLRSLSHQSEHLADAD
ncbi:MAG TPA: penicillin-binding transpeptidase domain-containing protein [Acidobacteriota bacterium]|nr:penicillin-binding transpeptidase domain-containing protein [Acidobacteriota bacterium]